MNARRCLRQNSILYSTQTHETPYSESWTRVFRNRLPRASAQSRGQDQHPSTGQGVCRASSNQRIKCATLELDLSQWPRPYHQQLTHKYSCARIAFPATAPTNTLSRHPLPKRTAVSQSVTFLQEIPFHRRRTQSSKGTSSSFRTEFTRNRSSLRSNRIQRVPPVLHPNHRAKAEPRPQHKLKDGVSHQ